MGQIKNELSIDFNIDALNGDFYIPTAHPIRRSDSIMLVTEASVQKLSLVIGAVQRGLSRTRQRWVIYVASDSCEVDDDFALWVYVDHIEMQAKDRARVESLLSFDNSD